MSKQCDATRYKLVHFNWPGGLPRYLQSVLTGTALDCSLGSNWPIILISRLRKPPTGSWAAPITCGLRGRVTVSEMLPIEVNVCSIRFLTLFVVYHCALFLK